MPLPDMDSSMTPRGGFNLVNRVLFPAPASSYGADSFAEELLWLPRSLTPEGSDPKTNVPCTFLTSRSARLVMLYLHGNAEDLGRCYAFCDVLRLQFQVNVLAVEYPGYGLCPGAPDEDSVIANARLGYRFLTEVLDFAPEDVVLIGRSIGSGPALYLGSQFPVHGVILVCPFLSVKEVVRTHVGRLADLIDERFPNQDRVKLVTGSLLVVHGQKDTLVPCTHGEALYEASRARKRLVTPADMNHNGNLLTDPEWFVTPVLEFFGLPDYNFEPLSIPPWILDARHSPFANGLEQTKRQDGLGGPPEMPNLLRSAPKDHKPTGNTMRAQPEPRIPVGVQPVLESDLQDCGTHEGVQEVMDSDLEDIASPSLSRKGFESGDEDEDDVAGAAVQYFMAMRSLQAGPTPSSQAHKARKALVAAPPEDAGLSTRSTMRTPGSSGQAEPLAHTDAEEEFCSMAHVIRQDLTKEQAQWCKLSIGPFCL
eukprot:TRINITY_DN31188_c0_g1_i1.p1 TRINITY_DN31188_c0_g1~~TRINITY_DN31188_c0_g1_i1.p1  ORF type:complete len:481 (-),score=81.73 TRINITY_DN31188_c0_g1_i1:21-1463(-)